MRPQETTPPEALVWGLSWCLAPLGPLGVLAGGTLGAARGMASQGLYVALGAVVAQDDGKFCEGTNITFFPGGPEGDPFATVVYNGAKAAEAALGPSVNYVWSNWSIDEMEKLFDDYDNF